MRLFYKSKAYIKVVGLLLFIILSIQVSAREQEIKVNELKIADQQLNVHYKRIMNNLGPSDQIKLKKAQRQWIAFRDLDCAWAFRDDLYVCLIERTKNRTKEFQEGAYYFIDCRLYD